ncbi:MAG TPA: thiamine-phosphate kinase [Streptosporangiaceae bacterium]
MTVADLGEFGLIAAIAARLPRDGTTIVGIGDDAAVLAASPGSQVATMDLLVEGRHFRRDWSRPEDVGGKAAAQNLADVAAMGATPVALLVGLAAPGDLPVAWAVALVDGLAAECARAGATVAGGDVSSADTIMIAVTALGKLAGAPVTRAGARPGDVLAVVGVLGHSAAGLALLSAGLAEPASLIAAHRWPRPVYQAGPEAAALGATSMIDVSDGLVADLAHVAQASGAGIGIDTARLAPGADLEAAAAALSEPGPALALRWMLTGGEDHALAATFPPGTRLPAHWTVLGGVHEGHGVQVDGRPWAGPAGWDHFG